DTWEIEHVTEIEFGYNEFVTQDDIIVSVWIRNTYFLIIDTERQKPMKRSFRLTIALACAGIICSFICVIYLSNKTGNMFSSSGEYEDTADTDNSKEEQHNPEEEKKYYDTWEIEHVTEIEFGYNEFVTQDDIIHIGQLVHLKRLKISIDESEIDLSPLSNLVELESLDIDIQYGCSPDLSFAENLSQLEKLDITVGSGVNLSPLGSLSKLRQLSMDTLGGDVDDLSFLKTLNRLEEVTFIKCCTIEDLSLFHNMQYLRRLDVAYVDDCDLSYLADLKNLETLAIIGENIRNPEGLSDLTHLKSLSLYDNSSDAMYGDEDRVSVDMQAFANLTELEWLDLYYIFIEDISPLSELKNLRHINLVDTNVSDILPLAGLEKLDELYLFGNGSETVKEQAETLFDQVEYKIVTEKVPEGI
ncbi:MAG: hypothetical protein K2J60_11375, partial [Acetatifactor sp.]|nr:hypothetical protein [Acetatifactor sp.]